MIPLSRIIRVAKRIKDALGDGYTDFDVIEGAVIDLGERVNEMFDIKALIADSVSRIEAMGGVDAAAEQLDALSDRTDYGYSAIDGVVISDHEAEVNGLPSMVGKTIELPEELVRDFHTLVPTEEPAPPKRKSRAGRQRTSVTNPLEIAEIRPAPGYGLIGITLCPGKVQPDALSGPWARDLDADLDVIARWNAAIVLTLITKEEMKTLQVTNLKAGVIARRMAWRHLPIIDGATPDEDFEWLWGEHSETVRSRLRAGANVLVHCKGGQGRAGTVAARLLIELGWEPDAAIAAVRRVRDGAIEKRQEPYVRRQKPVPEWQPTQEIDPARDRAIGAMLGLAVGDALGTTLEFSRRDSKPPLTDIIGGGPFGLKPGEGTDDTSMALALMASLAENALLDEGDLMTRFVAWADTGEYSVNGRCFDIGHTTTAALSRWKVTGDPVAGSTAPKTAGNGSLMRMTPVAIRHWRDRETLRDVAARQSRTTHAAPEAVDGCVAFAEVLADAIEGLPFSEVLRVRDEAYAGAIGPIMAGSWRMKTREAIQSSGYVAHSLEAALWCVARTTCFEEAVLLAANLGEDADTTAAITGQLAGAIYGASGIPPRWLEKLAWRERITNESASLFAETFRRFSIQPGDVRPLGKVDEQVKVGVSVSRGADTDTEEERAAREQVWDDLMRAAMKFSKVVAKMARPVGGEFSVTIDFEVMKEINFEKS